MWNEEKLFNSQKFIDIKTTFFFIQQRVRRIEEKLKNKFMYAVMTREIEVINVDNRADVTTTLSQRKVVEEQRRFKTFLIKINNSKKKIDTKLTHIKNILKKVERALNNAHKLIKLRCFSSSDLEFQMTICENKKKAVAELNWTKTIARSTQSLQRNYVVIAHDVRMRNVDVINQSQVIKNLTIQNVRIHKELRITKIV